LKPSKALSYLLGIIAGKQSTINNFSASSSSTNVALTDSIGSAKDDVHDQTFIRAPSIPQTRYNLVNQLNFHQITFNQIN
jgi:hypothetical protein